MPLKEKFKNWFFPHDEKADHFKSLDGLRGLAVLLVLLSHSSNMGYKLLPFLDFSGMGKIGVFLFFVLSAYLLDRQIALAFLQNKGNLKFWANYFLRRFLRIYPLFLGALLLAYLLYDLKLHEMFDHQIDIWSHLFLLDGKSIFWSIPVEFKYYFLSPLIMWFSHRILKWSIPLILLLFFLLSLSSFFLVKEANLPLVSTIRFLPIFLVGTLLSILELIRNKESISPKSADILGLFSIILIGISTPYLFDKLFNFNIYFHDHMFYLPFALLWGMVLFAAKNGKGLIRSLVEYYPLRFLGSISFSLYLFHLPILHFLRLSKFQLPSAITILVFLICSIGISILSYSIIERPLSKIRFRL